MICIYDQKLNRLELCISEINKERRRQSIEFKKNTVSARLREGKELRRMEDQVIVENDKLRRREPMLGGHINSGRYKKDTVLRELRGERTNSDF